MTAYRIWPATNGPDTAANGDVVSQSLGTEFYVTSAAWATFVHYYRGTAGVAPTNARIYRVDSATSGTVIAELTSLSSSGTGWQTFPLPSPVPLVVNQRYRVVFFFPFVGAGLDQYTATTDYWTGAGGGSSDIVNGILTAPTDVNTTGTNQGSFSNGTLAFPSNSFHSSNYWTDVTVTDVNPAAGGLPQRFTVNNLPTPLLIPGHGGVRVIVKNTDATSSADLGGSAVTAGGGFPLAAGATVELDVRPGEVVYAIRSAGADVVLAVFRS